jgi:branched-subunit amino acid transport protein
MIWIGVLAVGLGSFAFRAVPLLLGAGFALPERTQAILRHAGMGGIAALLISDILGIGSGNGFWTTASTVGAVAVGAVVAWRGGSMTLVVLIGGAVYVGLDLIVAAIACSAAP